MLIRWIIILHKEILFLKNVMTILRNPYGSHNYFSSAKEDSETREGKKYTQWVY